MDYWLDTEFNAYGGELITLALLREDNVMLYVGFKDNPIANLDPWVAANVMPIINSGPIPISWKTTAEIQQALLKLFKGDKFITIKTDWPDDVAYLSRLLMTGPGTMIGTPEEIPRIRFDIERVDSYPTMVKPAVQHNAAWDVLALRHKLQHPDDVPQVLETDGEFLKRMQDHLNQKLDAKPSWWQRFTPS